MEPRLCDNICVLGVASKMGLRLLWQPASVCCTWRKILSICLHLFAFSLRSCAMLIGGETAF